MDDRTDVGMCTQNKAKLLRGLSGPQLKAGEDYTSPFPDVKVSCPLIVPERFQPLLELLGFRQDGLGFGRLLGFGEKDLIDEI